MASVYIAVGSNIRPEDNVEKALALLSGSVRITGISTFYLTKPIERPDQPPFYNGVVEIETDLPPLVLRAKVLRAIEEKLERVRTSDKHAPRTIDLDIILYNDIEFNSGGLTLPDPDIQLRPFLAVPLHELAPEVVLPGTDTQLNVVAEGMKDHGMRPLSGFTARLKKRLKLETKAV